MPYRQVLALRHTEVIAHTGPVEHVRTATPDHTKNPLNPHPESYKGPYVGGIQHQGKHCSISPTLILQRFATTFFLTKSTDFAFNSCE